jgi:hypothetical protein
MARKPIPLDFAGVPALWPTLRDFCNDIKSPDATVRAWRSRDRIPPEHWDGIIAAARKRGIPGVSIDSLMGALRIALAREAAEKARAARQSKSQDRNIGA